MRKKLANLLIKLADKLCPEHAARVPKIEGYDSGRIAIAYVITPKEIKANAEKKKLSYSNSSKMLIAETKERIKQSIWLRIEKDQMIENRVLFTKEGTQVEGWLKVYVKKERGKKAVS